MAFLAMWCEAGFQPDSFWQQSPATFQACMDGARKRLISEGEASLSQSWHTGAFTAAAQAGKLKPLARYIKKPPRKMDVREMLANMKLIASRVNRKFGES
jgi:hypothetical protein